MSPLDALAGRLSDWWWARLPLLVLRLFTRVAVAMVDGLYLAAWPRVGALAPPLALLAGLALGWGHWTFDIAFSESLLILCLAAALGVLSAHLGLLFTIGFAVGDFFLADTPWTSLRFANWGQALFLKHLVQVRVPLLIQYSLMAMLTVNIPLVTKSLLAQFRPPASWPRPPRLLLATIGHGLLTYVLVYFWAQTVPLLIRPLFTWRGAMPVYAVMAPLQENSIRVIVVALIASVVRMYLQGMTASRPELSVRLDGLQERLAESEAIHPLDARLPLWLSVLAGAIWSTVLLSGMLEGRADWALLGAAVLVARAARYGLIAIRLGFWARLMERIPLLLRLIAGMLLVRLASGMILARQIQGSSFRPILMITVFAIVVTYLLTPPVRAPEGGRAA